MTCIFTAKTVASRPAISKCFGRFGFSETSIKYVNQFIKKPLLRQCVRKSNFFSKNRSYSKNFKMWYGLQLFSLLSETSMFWNLFWFMPFWFILNARKVLAVEIVPSVEMASWQHVQSHQMIDVSEKTKITKNLTIVVVAMQQQSKILKFSGWLYKPRIKFIHCKNWIFIAELRAEKMVKPSSWFSMDQTSWTFPSQCWLAV